jgi:hypothetical protein
MAPRGLESADYRKVATSYKIAYGFRIGRFAGQKPKQND